ncbi:hypothetical protein A9Q87_08035 [Flavobacteriales bacterium 34_180_T64]|nr:hypothetical protein A9Q87_08035 [Flavobacteriales bacterium 34_180_T64]
MNKLDNAYALIIGVGADLPDTVTDATAIYNVMVDDTICGYKEENVILLTNEKATEVGILKGLDTLIELTDENSSILIFYSGHGGHYQDANNNIYYLQPNDYDPVKFQPYVDAKDLRKKINALQSKRLILLLDCCHAAGMFKGETVGANQTSLGSDTNASQSQNLNEIEGLAQKVDDDRGISIVSSCREDQKSWIMPGDVNSLFTKCLIQVLRAQHKRYFEDEYIRISEIVQYIFRKVPEVEPRQNPYVNLQIYDDFILSLIPAYLKEQILPAGESTPTPAVQATESKGTKKEVVLSFREEEGNTNLLLFLHGFSGESSDTFGKIPELLIKDSKMDGWNMKPLGYTHHVKPEMGKDIWAGIDDVDKIADYLSTSIKYKFEDYNRIAIVAHSLGGLVAQRAIANLKKEHQNKISHLIMFGTPSIGIEAELLTKLWNSKYKAMSSDGAFITKLRQDWDESFSDGLPFKLKVAAATNDEYVSIKSCYTPFDAAVCETINGNHLSMVKPEDENNDAYNLILDTLNDTKFYNKYTNSEEINLTLGKYDSVVKELLPKVNDLDVNGLRQLIFSLEGLDRKDDALSILNENPLAKDNTDLMGIMGGRYKRAYLNSYSKSDGDAAFDYYSKALEIAEKEEDFSQIYYHAINLAFLSLVISGNESKMITYAQQALNATDECRNNLWKYATVAEANMYLDNMDVAKEFYTKSAEIADIRQKISMHTNAYAGYVALMQSDNEKDPFIKFLKSKFLS